MRPARSATWRLALIVVVTAGIAGSVAFSIGRRSEATPVDGAGAASPVPAGTATGGVRGGPAGRVLSVQVWSPALERHVPVLVYVPPGYPAPGVRYPTLYLLHGVPGTPQQMIYGLDTSSTMDTLIAEHRMPPAIVVAPTGGPTPSFDSEWADSPVHATWKWGTFVARDLVTWVDAHFRTCPVRGGRAIAGLSMGAFGAINLALRNLEEYGSVSMWSGYFVGNTPSVEGPSGTQGWRQDSPQLYLRSILPELRRFPLRISFYVGRSDGFEPQNVAFAHLLSQLGIPHVFDVYPGGHDWSLWRSHFAQQLAWLGQGLRC